jgi:type IV secretory pathway TraG/TraD family ATPase VirD4
MWPFKEKTVLRKRRPSRDKWKLSQPLLHWGDDEYWTIGDSFENTLVVGATGSGKSTGSGYQIAESAIRAGYGMLVLLAKDDREFWERICKRAGRRRDLVFFGPKEPWRFNFLDYELNHGGRGAGLTENVVSLFSTVLEMSERNTGKGGGREDEGYWRRSCRQLCRNAIDLLLLASGRVSIPDLYRVIVSAPSSLDETHAEAWQKHSYCFQCLKQAETRNKSKSQQKDFELVADYFLIEYPALSDKTRSIIVSSFTSMVDVLNRGLLRDLFCTETNITPEAVEDGYIVVVDLPVKWYGEVGLYSQALWKLMFQTAIERRNRRTSPRPVMLFADEAQFTVSSNDMHFLSTCRSSRVATVYLTQNISNFYAALGGRDNATVEADSVFGNLNTKIFHANGDHVTNAWAANLIGQERQHFFNSGVNHQRPHDTFDMMLGLGSGMSASAGASEQMAFAVEPSEFTRLKTGGRRNRWCIDAVVFQSGRIFPSTGRTWRFVSFKQRI